MLTLQGNYRMLYMVSTESTHPNPIHYNNIPAKIIET
jgi:hypothetical protein